MTEYIIEWSGIGARIVELFEEVPLWKIPKVLRKERLREPIVRCRDCRHMHTVRSWLGMDVDECWLHAEPESGALGKNRTEPNGFCAWGKRKEVDA